uniref:hypothetical protein n=1 Tax=Alicyclobacillus acidiphilus TaxID=182455 RepID=UPI001FE13CB7|nr:hypothetical protein [Alicyclobacillus acidiphilus]
MKRSVDQVNQDVQRTLEYHKMKEELSGYAMSYLGRQRIEAMEPSIHLSQIDGWLAETEDALRIVAGSSSVPIPSLDGMEYVTSALNKGQSLHVEQLEHIERFLTSTEQLRQYMSRKADVAPLVSGYAQSIVTLEDLRLEIRKSVDHGAVLDSASDELARIRKQIGILEERVRRKIEASLTKYKAHLQEPFHSIRNGRPVLPIKRESKRIVKGAMLDESASGQTVYIEPEEVASQQDELVEVRFAEAREVARAAN